MNRLRQWNQWVRLFRNKVALISWQLIDSVMIGIMIASTYWIFLEPITAQKGFTVALKIALAFGGGAAVDGWVKFLHSQKHNLKKSFEGEKIFHGGLMILLWFFYFNRWQEYASESFEMILLGVAIGWYYVRLNQRLKPSWTYSFGPLILGMLAGFLSPLVRGWNPFPAALLLGIVFQAIPNGFHDPVEKTSVMAIITGFVLIAVSAI